MRGNGERWLREPPADRPEVIATCERVRDQTPPDVVDWLSNLPPDLQFRDEFGEMADRRLEKGSD